MRLLCNNRSAFTFKYLQTSVFEIMGKKRKQKYVHEDTTTEEVSDCDKSADTVKFEFVCHQNYVTVLRALTLLQLLCATTLVTCGSVCKHVGNGWNGVTSCTCEKHVNLWGGSVLWFAAFLGVVFAMCRAKHHGLSLAYMLTGIMGCFCVAAKLYFAFVDYGTNMFLNKICAEYTGFLSNDSKLGSIIYLSTIAAAILNLAALGITMALICYSWFLSDSKGETSKIFVVNNVRMIEFDGKTYLMMPRGKGVSPCDDDELDIWEEENIDLFND